MQMSIIQLLLSLCILAYSTVCIADVRQLEFTPKKNTNLDGTWHYFPKHFINNPKEPHQVISNQSQEQYQAISVSLPNSFEQLIGQTSHHGSFIQTFRLPQAAIGEPVALFLPYQYGAYKLYIDDKLMLKVGVVGDEKQHVTEMAPRLLIFSVNPAEVTLRVDFSSYQHIRGGLENSIVIGYEEPVRRYFYLHVIPATWVSGMLVMISLFMALFAVYRLRHHQPIIPLLFLSLFILCFSLRSFFAVPFSYTLFTSIDWLLGTRIEYMLTGLISFFFLTYIRLALPHLLHKTIYIFLSCIIFANFLLILTQPPVVFQAFFFKTFAASILLFINMLYGVYKIFKYKNKFSKSNALAIGVVCLTFIHDYLLGLRLIDSVEIAFYTSCIYFIVVTLQLSRDYALQSEQAIAYNQELIRLNHTLDQQVAERTHTVIQLNEQLKIQLKLDGLTGAYNRFALNEMLQDYFSQPADKRAFIGFFMLDVDFFKNYNDYYGHLKGDEVLKKLVEVLRQQLPENGFLARYGGEEFTIILPNVSLLAAQAFAEQCLTAVRELNLQHQQRLDDKHVVTITIGGALMQPQQRYENADALIRCADLRLYQAKQQRDCAIVS